MPLFCRIQDFAPQASASVPNSVIDTITLTKSGLRAIIKLATTNSELPVAKTTIIDLETMIADSSHQSPCPGGLEQELIGVRHHLVVVNDKCTVEAKQIATFTAKMAEKTDHLAVLHTSLRSRKEHVQAVESMQTLQKTAAPFWRRWQTGS